MLHVDSRALHYANAKVPSLHVGLVVAELHLFEAIVN